jgi:HSP20 family molecular chaperone IbpA
LVDDRPACLNGCDHVRDRALQVGIEDFGDVDVETGRADDLAVSVGEAVADPGVEPDSLDLDIECNVLTVHAERASVDQNREMVCTERPRGVFTRQLF